MILGDTNPQGLQAINQAFAWWSRLGLLFLGIAYLYAKQPGSHPEDIILAGAPILYFFCNPVAFALQTH